MTGFTHHGGRLAEARARFGGEPGDWLDLSTGINPSPWPGANALEPDWAALPDPGDLTRLEETAAQTFSCDPQNCRAVAGSEAGIRALGQLLGLPAHHLSPLTYGSYAEAFARRSEGHDGPDVLIVTNPNNPDGQLETRTRLLARLKQQERRGGWLLVDEAFTDCDPAQSLADVVSDTRRLIVTRSFGKFFGLAGVRLGFVLAPRPLLLALQNLQGDWPLCAAAVTFGQAAYSDSTWIARTRIELVQRAEALDGVLTSHGLRATGACPLFRLIRVASASALFTHLAQARILTRPFAQDPQLLRLGLPADAQDLDRLDAALGARACHA